MELQRALPVISPYLPGGGIVGGDSVGGADSVRNIPSRRSLYLNAFSEEGTTTTNWFPCRGYKRQLIERALLFKLQTTKYKLVFRPFRIVGAIGGHLSTFFL